MSTITQSPTRNSIIVAKTNLPVLGMSCAACAGSIESVLRSLPGISSAEVNFAAQTVQIAYSHEVITLPEMQKAVQSFGYDLIIQEENASEQQAEIQEIQLQKLQRKTIGAMILALPTVIIGMFFMDMPYANWIMMGLSLPVLIFFGRDFFRNAWRQAQHGKANMDTLVAMRQPTANALL